MLVAIYFVGSSCSMPLMLLFRLFDSFSLGSGSLFTGFDAFVILICVQIVFFSV